MTKHFKKEEIETCTILELSNAVKEGKLIVFPTDTVYGIVTNAYDQDACERIYQVKGRPKQKPLIVLISDLSMLKELVAEVSPLEQRLMDVFWP